MQRQIIGFVLPKTDTVARIFKAALIFKTQGINSRQNVPYSLAGASRCFLFIWVFFHKYSRVAGHQGKGETISLAPLYKVHPFYRHLGIGRVITACSSLCIVSRKILYPTRQIQNIIFADL